MIRGITIIDPTTPMGIHWNVPPDMWELPTWMNWPQHRILTRCCENMDAGEYIDFFLQWRGVCA